MGSAQSLLTSQNGIAVVILVTIVVTVWRNTNAHASHGSRSNDKLAVSKKGKKKKAANDVQDTSSSASDKVKTAVRSAVVPNIEIAIPGGIPEPAIRTHAQESSVHKPAKEKKRKGKRSATPVPSATSPATDTPVAGPSRPSTGSGSSTVPQAVKRPSPPTEAWTRVESRRKASGQNQTTSDAGVTTATSVDEDGSSTGALEKLGDEGKTQSQKTLAERVLPQGRKTAVDDMLESSHYPELSRVMRVTPDVNEKPAAGFSWGDYDDVEDLRGADADGEYDGGWGVVKSRGKAKRSQSSLGGTSTPQPKAPETLTKKQKQRAAKREADKAARADADADRLGRLAAHKRELDRIRIAEQYPHKSNGAPGRTLSGGQTAAVVSDGKLVWD